MNVYILLRIFIILLDIVKRSSIGIAMMCGERKRQKLIGMGVIVTFKLRKNDIQNHKRRQTLMARKPCI